MVQISFFSITDYKERASDLYAFMLANECKKVADCILESGSVVGDLLIITNPKIVVPDKISNTAIFSVCLELLGNVPEKIEPDGDDFKTFSLE
jgi:hypothetical protein